MKKVLAFFLTIAMAFAATACGGEPEKIDPVTAKIEETQMRSICELATMDCYYHNVAKCLQKGAWKFLWWSKDKHFWVEYSGRVRLGIDASLVKVGVDGDQVKISLPPAKVLSCTVDSDSLTEDSYIRDKGSADITAEDEMQALTEAQEQLEKAAGSNQELLNDAQQRAQMLLRDYVTNIGNALGQTYTIQWVMLDANGNPGDLVADGV